MYHITYPHSYLPRSQLLQKTNLVTVGAVDESAFEGNFAAYPTYLALACGQPALLGRKSLPKADRLIECASKWGLIILTAEVAAGGDLQEGIVRLVSYTQEELKRRQKPALARLYIDGRTQPELKERLHEEYNLALYFKQKHQRSYPGHIGALERRLLELADEFARRTMRKHHHF